MQDPTTGDMIPIGEEFAKALRAGHRQAEAEARYGHTDATRVLCVGEEVHINGGRFKIVSLGRRFVRLEGLPLDGPDLTPPSVCRACGEPCRECEARS